jgi:hypothetical protein
VANDPFTTGLAFISFLIYGLILLPYLLLGLAIPYAVLRLRDAQNRRPDPQLGFKVALQFFFSLSVLLVLSGLTYIVVDFVMDLNILGAIRPGRQPLFGQRGEFPNSAQRTGLAIILSGALFAVVHAVLFLALTRERNRGPSPARRMFLGWRFAIHGVVVLFSLTGLLIILFQKESVPLDEMRRFFIGVLLVWVPSWFLHFVLLRVSSPMPERAEGVRFEEE